MSTGAPSIEQDVQREHGHRIQPAYGHGDFELWVGADTTVVLGKAYGPLIFADIRIRADAGTCQWVIERETHVPHGIEEDCSRATWTEVARVDGQIAADSIGHENG